MTASDSRMSCQICWDLMKMAFYLFCICQNSKFSENFRKICSKVRFGMKCQIQDLSFNEREGGSCTFTVNFRRFFFVYFEIITLFKFYNKSYLNFSFIDSVRYVCTGLCYEYIQFFRCFTFHCTNHELFIDFRHACLQRIKKKMKSSFVVFFVLSNSVSLFIR